MKCGGSHIALNADAQTAYELFAGKEENFGDVELLYRAMYHKIGNEVAILKSIAQRLLRKIAGEHPLVREIVQDLEDLQATVVRQRATEKATIATLPHDDYRQTARPPSPSSLEILLFLN